jgi:DNA repair ATPase RecN
MNPSQDFNHLYSDVSESIAAAMAEIADLKVEHKEGKKELSNIMERLRNIQTRFDGELDLLEQHAEWDKFTMAFFGETGAGKSTVIESLRILFKEESRQQLLEQNAQDLTKYEQALVGHVNEVREGLNGVYTQYAAEIVALKRSTAVLAQVLQEESSARIKRKLWLYAFGGLGVGGAVAASLTRLTGLVT